MKTFSLGCIVEVIAGAVIPPRSTPVEGKTWLGRQWAAPFPLPDIVYEGFVLIVLTFDLYIWYYQYL